MHDVELFVGGHHARHRGKVTLAERLVFLVFARWMGWLSLLILLSLHPLIALLNNLRIIFVLLFFEIN